MTEDLQTTPLLSPPEPGKRYRMGVRYGGGDRIDTGNTESLWMGGGLGGRRWGVGAWDQMMYVPTYLCSSLWQRTWACARSMEYRYGCLKEPSRTCCDRNRRRRRRRRWFIGVGSDHSHHRSFPLPPGPSYPSNSTPESAFIRPEHSPNPNGTGGLLSGTGLPRIRPHRVFPRTWSALTSLSAILLLQVRPTAPPCHDKPPSYGGREMFESSSKLGRRPDGRAVGHT